MRKVLLAVSLVLGAMLITPLSLLVPKNSSVSSKLVNKNVKDQPIPESESDLQILDPKVQDVSTIITLEAKNTVVLRGPVTGSSVAKAMKSLGAMSRKISKDTPIYLVLDTPGGSIFDGLDLIDFAKALPQKVNTVTLFAASMGFQIAQNLDTRYIIRNGTLMSHRARVSGLEGQIKGEFEARYKMIRRAVDFMDYTASKRMSTSLKDYENMIFNEYWVYGYDAVAQKAADQEVLVRCGESMGGTEEVEFETFFGDVTVTFSQCPLIKSPEKIEMNKIKAENRQGVEYMIRMALEDKRRFIDEYIVNNRFYEYFR